MDNLSKYNNVFVEALGVDVNDLGPDFTNQTVDEWDSVGHMSLISLLEEEFDIMLEPEDLMLVTSYENGKKVLEKYDIKI